MTVQQLIEALQQIDPEILVCGYAADESFAVLISIGEVKRYSGISSEPFGVASGQQFVQLHFDP